MEEEEEGEPFRDDSELCNYSLLSHRVGFIRNVLFNTYFVFLTKKFRSFDKTV